MFLRRWFNRSAIPLNSSPLEVIRAKFDALVGHLDVNPSYKRIATSRTDDGGPHIEHYGKTYAYVVTERGSEYERRETEDADELLYWLVSDTTREAAGRFELGHRVPGEDCRRLLFSKHLQLLESIRPEWASTSVGNVTNPVIGYNTAPSSVTAGTRFLGVPPENTSTIYGITTEEIDYTRHRTGSEKNAGYRAVGKVNIVFADGHVEGLKPNELANPATNQSRLRALWSPYDYFIP